MLAVATLHSSSSSNRERERERVLHVGVFKTGGRAEARENVIVKVSPYRASKKKQELRE